MADDPKDRVAPYSLINSPIPSSGLYSRDVSLAHSRKHAFPTSSDLVEPPSKRGVLSDSHGQVILGNVPSSPPVGMDESETEEDEASGDDLDSRRMSSIAMVAKNASRSDSAATLVTASASLGSPSVAQRLGSTTSTFAARTASRGGSMSLQNLPSLSPVAVIRDAVDAGCDTVNLAERGIEELPSEIEDLQHWVSLDRTTLKVCLGHNRIQHLHLGLFQVNISELLLRHNELERIPQQIGQLSQLTELSVGSNNLTYLPAELLSLPNLSVLLTVPNPWIPLPDGVENNCADRMPSFVFRQVRSTASPPSLAELAQRVLADHALLRRDRKSWALSEHQQRLVDLAEQARDRGYLCFKCRKPYIRPVAHATEWWNVCHNKALPFRKFYCTRWCLRNDIYD